jgi:hypothetical protein
MTRPGWWRAGRAAAAAAAFALVAACGYSAGPLTRHDFRRVYIPMFRNLTFWRDFEVGLTHEVEIELGARPGISIVPQESADIVLAGTIVDFQQHVLTESTTDAVRESSTVMRVRVDVKDARTGEVERTFEVRYRSTFIPSDGQTATTSAQSSFVPLARRIVDGIEDDFPRASATARGETPTDVPAEAPAKTDRPRNP